MTQAKRWTRRGFFVGALAVAALAAAGLLFRSGIDYESVIARMVRRRLGYLRHDPAGLEAFAREYARRHPRSREHVVRLVGRYRLRKYNDVVRELEADVARQYLISSDFFFEGRREDRVVRYLHYYDPYEIPCYNPLLSRV